MSRRRTLSPRRAWDLVVIGAALFASMVAMLVLSALLEGCAPETPAEVAATTYGAELQACVAKASSRAESRACRARVDCRWGQGPCPDASVPLEGGAP